MAAIQPLLAEGNPIQVGAHPAPPQGFMGRIHLVARNGLGHDRGCIYELKLSSYQFSVLLAYAAVIGLSLFLCAAIAISVVHNPLLLAVSIGLMPGILAVVGGFLTRMANILLEKLANFWDLDARERHKVFAVFYPQQPGNAQIAQ